MLVLDAPVVGSWRLRVKLGRELTALGSSSSARNAGNTGPMREESTERTRADALSANDECAMGMIDCWDVLWFLYGGPLGGGLESVRERQGLFWAYFTSLGLETGFCSWPVACTYRAFTV